MQSVGEYIGVCDAIDGHVVRGWVIRRDGQGQCLPCRVTVTTNLGSYACDAGEFRRDLADIYGVNFGGFELRVPSSEDVTAVIADDVHSMSLPSAGDVAMSPRGRGHLDAFEGGVFRGWATAEGDNVARVDLKVDGGDAGSLTATSYRPDLLSEGVSGGYGGFRIRPPLWVERQRPVRFSLSVGGAVIGERTVRLPARRVLIVSETENLDDASRRFRCDHLRDLFFADGIDARVIGPDDFKRKEWPGYDVIVFARFGVDDAMAEKISRYKESYRTRIVYEIDDLVFLPWHTHDLGSVRSGVDNANNPGLKQMFARRLRLVALADAAITTTEALARRFAAMGLPVLMLPNMVPEHEIAVSPRTAAPQPQVRLLCMAGSQTHYRDFQLIEGLLEGLCRDYPDKLSLTLLGKFKDDLPLVSLPNVSHVARVPYEEMLYLIDEHDLCLVPLEQTEFNDAKSCLKFIECGARGVPVLASSVADYARAITHSVDGFVSNSFVEWRGIIEDALSGRINLNVVGAAAKAVVAAQFTLETTDARPGRWLQEVFHHA